METKRILITPALAEDYLKSNTGNRRVRETVVRQYAANMERGLWCQNDGLINPITFSKTGRLLDGQHRLLAVIRSGVAVWFYVVTGADEEIFYFFDGGEKRRLSDQIDCPNATAVAAIAKKMAAFSSGAPIGRAINGNFSTNRSATRDEARLFYNSNQELCEDAASRAMRMYRACNAVRTSIYGTFCAFVIWLGIGDQIDEFVDDYCDSSMNQQTQFVKMTFFKKNAAKSEKLTMTQKFVYLLMAYEKYRKDEVLLTLNKAARYAEIFNEEIRKKVAESE